jgi:D-glycero-alpha-D-manno-heptose-7-phosphate kinase
MLFYLRSKRNASKILEIQEQNTPQIFNNLTELKNFVDPIRNIFSFGEDINKLGDFLNQSWEIKKSLTDAISSSEIDNYYKEALDSGAIGGKLLGAGGGGFLLLYVEKKNQQSVISKLSNLFHLNVGFDQDGTRITYYDQSWANIVT